MKVTSSPGFRSHGMSRKKLRPVLGSVTGPRSASTGEVAQSAPEQRATGGASQVCAWTAAGAASSAPKAASIISLVFMILFSPWPELSPGAARTLGEQRSRSLVSMARYGGVIKLQQTA